MMIIIIMKQTNTLIFREMYLFGSLSSFHPKHYSECLLCVVLTGKYRLVVYSLINYQNTTSTHVFVIEHWGGDNVCRSLINTLKAVYCFIRVQSAIVQTSKQTCSRQNITLSPHFLHGSATLAPSLLMPVLSLCEFFVSPLLWVVRSSKYSHGTNLKLFV